MPGICENTLALSDKDDIYKLIKYLSIHTTTCNVNILLLCHCTHPHSSHCAPPFSSSSSSFFSSSPFSSPSSSP